MPVRSDVLATLTLNIKGFSRLQLKIERKGQNRVKMVAALATSRGLVRDLLEVELSMFNYSL